MSRDPVYVLALANLEDRNAAMENPAQQVVRQCPSQPGVVVNETGLAFGNRKIPGEVIVSREFNSKSWIERQNFGKNPMLHEAKDRDLARDIGQDARHYPGYPGRRQRIRCKQ